MSTGEPGTNNTAHRRDWETQRERLSAYLDDQLAPDERAALERHLPTCERCAAELAELRRTVALLHAMPAPALPRSFALPASAAQAEEVRGRERPADEADRERSLEALTPSSVRRPFRAALGAAPWAGIAQWAGGLAAVAGLVVLLGGALAGLPSGFHAGGASTAAGPASLASQHTPERVPPPTPPANGTADAANQSSKSSPTAAPSVAPSVTNAPVATPAFAPRTADTNGPALPILPLTGGGLVLGGGLIFIAASVVRRRSA